MSVYRPVFANYPSQQWLYYPVKSIERLKETLTFWKTNIVKEEDVEDEAGGGNKKAQEVEKGA